MSEAREAPLGLLGGTFDPIHHAHLRLALEAQQTLGLHTVRLIPAGQPKHRDTPGSSPEHRLAMARLAVEGVPQLEVDAAEVLSDAPSYTVPTLERLRADLGATRPLVLLMGVDAFQGLARWHRWQALLDLAHIGVATRPGYALGEATLEPALAALLRQSRTDDAAALATTPAGMIIPFDITALDISATAIRAQFARGASPRFLLPDAVVDYIDLHHLYQN